MVRGLEEQSLEPAQPIGQAFWKLGPLPRRALPWGRLLVTDVSDAGDERVDVLHAPGGHAADLHLVGKRPVRTPSHQVERATGMSCRTPGSRRKPVCGSCAPGTKYLEFGRATLLAKAIGACPSVRVRTATGGGAQK